MNNPMLINRLSSSLRSRSQRGFTLRFYSTSACTDLRDRLLKEVKTAMKNKDSLTSTALRSVLAEVYLADKTAKNKVTSSTIISIMRKAIQRRNDSAAQFSLASRDDLASKERQEANMLSKLLPPLLSESEIDRILNNIIPTLPDTDKSKILGKIFKAFYAQVDKSNVDPELVKTRASLLASQGK